LVVPPAADGGPVTPRAGRLFVVRSPVLRA